LEAGNAAALHKKLNVSSSHPMFPADGNVGIDTSNKFGLAAPPKSFALKSVIERISLAIGFDPPFYLIIQWVKLYQRLLQS
jgi:hypothetical protein